MSQGVLSEPTPPAAVAVSAPGKVLFAGGYLVLDRAHRGLVLGLDARIHVLVAPAKPDLDRVNFNASQNATVTASAPQSDLKSPGVGFQLTAKDAIIQVRSPQFRGAVWRYRLQNHSDQQGVQAIPLPSVINVDITSSEGQIGTPPNPFVETTLTYAASYLQAHGVTIASIDITVLADADYYSSGLQASTASVLSSVSHETAKSFHDFGVPLQQASKTGLGSSAALVTALTGALLAFHVPNIAAEARTAAPLSDARRRIHNLAQAAHGAAQGKIGSGFDVAAAVYGSCIYRRFSPEVLHGVGDAGSPQFAQRLTAVIDDDSSTAEANDGAIQHRKWDTSIETWTEGLPPGIRLVMCDVTGGSQTPGLVRTVLAWRVQNPGAAAALWHKIQAAIEALVDALRQPSTVSASETTTPPSAVSDSASPHDATNPHIDALRPLVSDLRRLIQQLSRETGVPIEPPAQTRLLDACERQVQGVVGGVVPGAGGYDALALLVEDRPEVVEALDTFLANYHDSTENTPSTDPSAQSEEDQKTQQGTVRRLGVRMDTQGLHVEAVETYQAWLQRHLAREGQM